MEIGKPERVVNVPVPEPIVMPDPEPAAPEKAPASPVKEPEKVPA